MAAVSERARYSSDQIAERLAGVWGDTIIIPEVAIGVLVLFLLAVYVITRF
jgi:hypothetical protein